MRARRWFLFFSAVLLTGMVSAPGVQAGISEMGCYTTSGDTCSKDVYVIGDYAYVPCVLGLATYNVSDPTNIRKIHFEPAPSPNWSTVHYTGDGFLYLTCSSGGFHTLDLSNPEAPSYITSLDIVRRDAEDAVIVGDYAYVVYSLGGTKVVSMDETRSVLSEYYSIPMRANDRPYGVDSDGTYLYVAVGGNGIRIRTLASLLAQTDVLYGSIDFGTPVAKDVIVSGNWAFVCCGDDGLYVLDISNPASPTLHATYDTPGSAEKVAVVGDFIYVADDAGGLRVFEISVLPLSGPLPGTLTETDYYTPSGDPAATYAGVFATNGFVYVADKLQGVRILDAGSCIMDMQRSFPRQEWRLMGIPTTVSTGDAIALFGDDFANSDPGSPNWRVSRWDETYQTYIRYQETDGSEWGGDDDPAPFEPGLGYWVLQDVVDNCRMMIDENQNTGIVDQATTVEVALEPGREGGSSYTQVANPFHYPYDLSATEFSVSGVGTLAWSEAGAYLNGYAYTWDGTQYVAIPWNESINPWTGFWVIQTDGTKTISICFPPEGSSAKHQPSGESGISSFADWEPDQAWNLNLQVQSADGIHRDQYNRIGVAAEAGDGYDSADALELTPINSRFVQLYFDHDSWGERAAKYTYDTRSPEFGVEGKVWEATVRVWRLPNRTFEISWTGMEEIQGCYNLFLLRNEDEPVELDMRNQSTVEFQTGPFTGDYEYFHFSIKAEHTFHQTALEINSADVPQDFGLSASPNPFNASTILTVNLLDRTDLSVSIYNVLGQKVAQVIEAELAAGRHRFRIDSSELASGTYFLRASENNIPSKSLKLVVEK